MTKDTKLLKELRVFFYTAVLMPLSGVPDSFRRHIVKDCPKLGNTQIQEVSLGHLQPDIEYINGLRTPNFERDRAREKAKMFQYMYFVSPVSDTIVLSHDVKYGIVTIYKENILKLFKESEKSKATLFANTLENLFFDSTNFNKVLEAQEEDYIKLKKTPIEGWRTVHERY